MSSPSSSSSLAHGSGRITVAAHGDAAVFEELASTYPLKLLAPRVQRDVARVAVVYVLSYGGGLVGGDEVNVDVRVGEGAGLVMLSQGSTKVFKSRPTARRASFHPPSSTPTSSACETKQTLTATLAPHATLLLLPDPVTPFAGASYTQHQSLHLAPAASAVLLDWVTAGRAARGEAWAFARYWSCNELWAGGVRLARDATLLEGAELGRALAPYGCYATLLLAGPATARAVRELRAAYDAIRVYRQGGPPELVWALSPVGGAGGEGEGAAQAWVVRVAGRESEQVRRWIGRAVGAVEDVVGVDTWRRTFG